MAAKKKGGDDGEEEEEGAMGLGDLMEAQKGFVPVDMDEETQMKMLLEMEYTKNAHNIPKSNAMGAVGGGSNEEDDPELAAAIAASLAMMNIDG